MGSAARPAGGAVSGGPSRLATGTYTSPHTSGDIDYGGSGGGAARTTYAPPASATSSYTVTAHLHSSIPLQARPLHHTKPLHGHSDLFINDVCFCAADNTLPLCLSFF